MSNTRFIKILLLSLALLAASVASAQGPPSILTMGVGSPALGAAITVRQGATSTTAKHAISPSSALTLAFPSNPLAGSLLVYVECQNSVAAASMTAPTDNNSNTILLAKKATDSVGIWYVASSNAGATTVTVPNNGGNDQFLQIWEITGTTGTLDQTGTSTATSSSQTVSTSSATSAVSEIGIGAFFDKTTNSSVTLTGGYSGFSDPGTAGSESLGTGSKTFTGGATQTATATIGASDTCQNVIATFK